MYNWYDIVWIKNVLRDHGNGWAYDDKSFEDSFFLNWPVRFRGSVMRAKVGDIIVLFQTPKVINGRNNKTVYLTHLVTPIDDIEYEDPNFPNFKYCRRVRLIAMANPITAIPNPGYFNFHKPNRGQTHPIKNLGDSRTGVGLEQTQQSVLDLFRNFINPQFQFAFNLPVIEVGITGEVEGDTVILGHVQLERRIRSTRIPKMAKMSALQRGNGYIECECCRFDFRRTYGDIGIEYIECHHKNFLANGERLTTPEDLALVCSNCHRMLHRKKTDTEYYSVEELRELINSNRAVIHE